MKKDNEYAKLEAIYEALFKSNRERSILSKKGVGMIVMKKRQKNLGILI